MGVYLVLGIIVVLLAIGVTAYILIKRSLKGHDIPEEHKELLEGMDDNADILINLATQNRNIIYAVAKTEGFGLGGSTIIQAFPRDILVKDGEYIQSPDISKEIFIHKRRLFTLSDRTRSPKNIHIALPKELHELPPGEFGEIFRPYLLMKGTVDSVVNSLIKQGKQKEEMMDILAEGEMENKVFRTIDAMKGYFGIEGMAKDSIEAAFPK